MSGEEKEPARPKRGKTRRWVWRAFLTSAVVSTAWLANSVRTQGVSRALLEDSETSRLMDRGTRLEFVPVESRSRTGTGLVFLAGSGIGAEAYRPLLRPPADAGHPVCIVRMPFASRRWSRTGRRRWPGPVRP